MGARAFLIQENINLLDEISPGSEIFYSTFDFDSKDLKQMTLYTR